MWSPSVEVLNPWDALCESKEKYVDADIDHTPAKRSIKSVVANWLRNIADMLDN